MLGAMGVATHDIPAHSIWGGVPAREIKARKPGLEVAQGEDSKRT
jgi:acetyltransferase-like isoleucine patch superfamily enzyme